MITITVASHKGGSGKTTSAVTLAYLAYEAGDLVYLIDLDPNQSATNHLITEPITGPGSGEMISTSYPQTIDDVSREVRVGEGQLLLIPGSDALIAANHEMLGDPRRLELLLEDKKKELAGRASNVVNIIDCGQGIDMLTLNGTMASDALICPINCTGMALSGMRQFREMIDKVKRNRWGGKLYFLPTIYSRQTGRLEAAEMVIDALEDRFGTVEDEGQVLPSIRMWNGYDKAFRQGEAAPEIDGGRRGNKASEDYGEVLRLLLHELRPEQAPARV